MLGALLPIAGGILDNIFAGQRQEDAQAFSAQQYATRHQTQVKDLIAAGLNPMLSASQGPGSSPQSSAASPGNNFTQAALQAENLKAQARLTNAQAAVLEKTGQDQANAQLDLTKAQGNLTSAQLDNVQAEFHNILARTAQSVSQAKQIEAQTDKIIAEIKNVPLEGRRLEMAASQLYSSASLLSQQQLTESQRWDLVKAQAKKVLAETGLINYDLAAAAKLDNLGREATQLKPIVEILKTILQATRR
jgi:hypothetical protein